MYGYICMYIFVILDDTIGLDKIAIPPVKAIILYYNKFPIYFNCIINTIDIIYLYNLVFTKNVSSILLSYSHR